MSEVRREALPTGFMYGNEVPRTPYKPKPQHAPSQRPPEEPPELYCLADALDIFRARMTVRKKDNVTLKHGRVGVIFEHEITKKVYLVMFKRSTYLRFARHFEVPEQGVGVVCNMKLVAWAAGEGIELVAIFSDGACYSIPAMTFWEYYEQYKTDVKHIPGEIASPLELWNRMF